MFNGYMNLKNNVEGHKYVLNAILQLWKFTQRVILLVLQSVSIRIKFSACFSKSALLSSTYSP